MPDSPSRWLPEALLAHDADRVATAVRRGMDLNDPLHAGARPARHALELVLQDPVPVAFIEQLLAMGADPCRPGTEDMTPLLWAVGTRQPEVAMALVRAGAQRSQEARGQSVWHVWASPERTTSVVRVHLRQALDRRAVQDDGDENPEPMLAVFRAIQAEQEIHHTDVLGHAPLEMALREKRWPVVHALDAMGLDWHRPVNRQGLLPEALLRQLLQSASPGADQAGWDHWLAYVQAKRLSETLEREVPMAAAPRRVRL